MFILYETASGYSLFEVSEFDEIGQSVDKVQEAIRWGKLLLSLSGPSILFVPHTAHAANAPSHMHTHTRMPPVTKAQPALP